MRATRAIGPELMAPAAVALVAALAFLPGLTGDFVWDDVDLIVVNARRGADAPIGESLVAPFMGLAGEEGERGGYFRPVVRLAYVLEYQLFGPQPFGYHLVSLVLHVVCSLLAFGWLARRLGPADPHRLGAAIGGALFALHPSRVETVSWISGSPELWMVALVLGALWAWDRLRGRRRLVLSTALFVLAVGAKESAAAAPLLLLIDPVARLPARPGAPSRGWAALPICAAWAALGMRMIWVPAPSQVGAYLLSQFAPRVLSTIGHYVRLVVCPWPSSMFVGVQTRGADGLVHFVPWSLGVGGGFLAAVAACVAVAIRKPAFRCVPADLGWFLVALAPALNVVPLNLKPIAAERFLYLPLLGVAALVARVVSNTARRPGFPRALALIASSVVLLAVGQATLRSQGRLADEPTLWAHESALHPNNTFLIERLANEKAASGDRRGAGQLYARGYRVAMENREADEAALFALRAADLRARQISDADSPWLDELREFFDAAWTGPVARLRIPGFSATVNVPPGRAGGRLAAAQDLALPRAVLYGRLGRLEEARAQTEAIVRQEPRAAPAWLELALCYARTGDWARARAAVHEAERRARNPVATESVRVHIARAEQYSREGDPGTIVRATATAQALLELGARATARRVCEEAMVRFPEDPRPHLMRARIDMADGRPDLARASVLQGRMRLPQHEPLWAEALREADAAIARSSVPE